MKSNNRVLAVAGVAILVVAMFAVLATAWLTSGGPASADTTGKAGSTDNAPAATSTAQQPKTTTVTVRGTGSVSAKPDTIKMNIGVSIIANTVKSAQDQVSKATDSIVGKLSSAGIAEADYRTSQYNVEPIMDYGGDKGGAQQTPRLTGFRVTNILEITLRDASKAPALLDELVSAGANTIYNINYTFADPDALAKQAYDSAVKDAQTKAERLAGLSNLTLGRVINVTDSSANVPGPIYSAIDAGRGGAGTVYPGQQAIQSDVIVTYEAAAK